MTPEIERGHVQPQRTQRPQRDTENLHSLCLSVLSVSSVVQRAARQPLIFRAARDLGGRWLEDRALSHLPPRSLATLGMTRNSAALSRHLHPAPILVCGLARGVEHLLV